LALMGLGVAWLAMDRATGSRSDGVARVDRRSDPGPGTYARAEGRVGPYRGDAVHESGSSTTESMKDRAMSAADKAKASASGIAGTMKEKASSAADIARRKASDAKERLRSSDYGDDGASENEGPGFGTRMREGAGHMSRRAGDMSHRAGDMAGRARHEAAHRARRAKSGLRTAMDEQPLALGAVAFGLGLASGLAAPTTRWEDRAMGGASDHLKHETGSMLKETAEDAKQVAKDTAVAAKEEADRQGIGENLKEAGLNIAAQAKETARERGRDKGLTPEEIEQRASGGSGSSSGSERSSSGSERAASASDGF